MDCISAPLHTRTHQSTYHTTIWERWRQNKHIVHAKPVRRYHRLLSCQEPIHESAYLDSHSPNTKHPPRSILFELPKRRIDELGLGPDAARPGLAWRHLERLVHDVARCERDEVRRDWYRLPLFQLPLFSQLRTTHLVVLVCHDIGANCLPAVRWTCRRRSDASRGHERG